MLEETSAIYGKKLKCLRINLFITQKEMALKFKISQQAYAALEAGKTKFTLKKTEKICKIFKIPVDEFITIHTKQVKTKKKSIDSYNVRVLKTYYERLLLEKDIQIDKLEIKLKHFQKDKKIGQKLSEIRVMI